MGEVACSSKDIVLLVSGATICTFEAAMRKVREPWHRTSFKLSADQGKAKAMYCCVRLRVRLCGFVRLTRLTGVCRCHLPYCALLLHTYDPQVALARLN